MTVKSFHMSELRRMDDVFAGEGIRFAPTASLLTSKLRLSTVLVARAPSLCHLTTSLSLTGQPHASKPAVSSATFPSVPSDGRLSVSPMPVLSRGSS